MEKETPLPAAHASAIAWMKIKTATSQDLRAAISDLERFTGEIGELNHFIKGADLITARIDKKVEEDLLDGEDAAALRAALICRVKRNILNRIQADQDTPWAVIKERLKKAYGGGRWTLEEDIFQMFKEVRQPRQTNGQFAGVLLARFNQVTEKMRESLGVVETEARMAFLATILKVQIARETGKKEGLPRDRTFVECAQDIIDAGAREEEARIEIDESGWERVPPRRPISPRKLRNMRGGGEKTRERMAKGRPWQKENRKCHGCGKIGHLVAQCPRTKCFECGAEGHIARQCPYMYRRHDVGRGEPMEINAQRVRKRTRLVRNTETSSEGSAELSESSGAEEEEEEKQRRHRGWEKTASGRRKQSASSENF